MGKNLLYIFIGFAIAYAIGYFLMKGMKIGAAVKEEEKKTSTPEPEYIMGLPAPDHSSQALADMFSGDEWRKSHPILI